MKKQIRESGLCQIQHLKAEEINEQDQKIILNARATVIKFFNASIGLEDITARANVFNLSFYVGV